MEFWVRRLIFGGGLIIGILRYIDKLEVTSGKGNATSGY